MTSKLQTVSLILEVVEGPTADVLARALPLQLAATHSGTTTIHTVTNDGMTGVAQMVETSQMNDTSHLACATVVIQPRHTPHPTVGTEAEAIDHHLEEVEQTTTRR